MFLLDLISTTKKARATKGVNENSTRKNSTVYYLPKDCEKFRVCKVFLNDTLDITDRKTRTLIMK